MVGKDLIVGGTPGAQSALGLAEFVAVKFSFSDEQRGRLLELCPPSDHFLEWYRQHLVEFVATPELAVMDALEACARRFLRNKIKPISKADQKKYLQSIELHTEALKRLFTDVIEFDHSMADPFQFLEIAAKDRRTRRDHWTQTLGMLTSLNFFAKWRLSHDMKPGEKDIKEKTRRKTEYPRMVLIADLLAAYQRVTGANPTAYAQRPEDNVEGRRRVSAAVDFISVAVPPILKAARVKNPEVLDDQLIRKEIAQIKRLWDEGQHPEWEYQLRNWS